MIKAIPEGAEPLKGPDKAESWEDQRRSYSINHKWLCEEENQVLMTENHPVSEKEKTAFLLWVSLGTADGEWPSDRHC